MQSISITNPYQIVVSIKMRQSQIKNQLKANTWVKWSFSNYNGFVIGKLIKQEIIGWILQPQYTYDPEMQIPKNESNAPIFATKDNIEESRFTIINAPKYIAHIPQIGEWYEIISWWDSNSKWKCYYYVNKSEQNRIGLTTNTIDQSGIYKNSYSIMNVPLKWFANSRIKKIQKPKLCYHCMSNLDFENINTFIYSHTTKYVA